MTRPNLLIRIALKLTGYGWSTISVAVNPFSVQQEYMITIYKK